MSEVTEIIGEGGVQLEVIEISGGTIEVIGEDKTTIEIVENTSTTNDLNISTQINTVVVDSNPSEGTSINISEDSPTTIEIESPPVSVDIIDKVLVSGTSELSFNNLVDRPFTINNGRLVGPFNISGSISASSISVGDINTNGNISASGNFNFDGDNRHIFFGNQNVFVGELSNSNKLELRGGGSTGNQTVYIDSSGNLGIGKSTPTEKLEVIGNVSASGLLFASASEFKEAINRNLQINPGVVVYDTASGRFYYTGSYGGGGSGDATLSFVTGALSESLEFNGNRIITRLDISEPDGGVPTLNLRTSGSIVNFLEAYFFPNDPPTIVNGHLGNATIPSIEEFKPSGSQVYTLIATDPQSDTQTLAYSTSSTYTADALKIHPTEGTITLNVLASESLNTDINNFYSGLTAHKFPIIVTDSFGAFTEEDLYFRISPNQSPRIFNSRNQDNDVTNETVNLTLYETSSFSESIANSNLSAIEILSVVDPEGDTVTIESGSLSDGFENDFKIIIEGNTVKLSQSKAVLDFATHEEYTFQITASDEHYISGLDSESTSSVTYKIIVVDNENPIINPTSFNINEKSEDNFVIGNLIDNSVLTDPDGNESNLGVTNVTLIGVFSASSDTVSGSNLTGSFGGTSLLDPNENPISFAGNNITRKPNQFLNVDLINLYKYNLTPINTTTGVTGSSGIVSINVDNHIPNYSLTPNQSEGNIIESSRIEDPVVLNFNGLTPPSLKIESTDNTYQNWIVTSSQGDFFEGVTFGVQNENFLNEDTGSQIKIRLKQNISGSEFKSGSIVTCSITASQNDFPTTKHFFEIPINIKINQSPNLSKIDNTTNWVNTVATQSTSLVAIKINDPEGDNINNNSFQLIGNSSTDLSASIINNQFVIQADNTLAHSDQYNNFEFTASIADEHGFRTSSISGDIELVSPTIPTSASNAITDEFIFYTVESSIESNNVVTNEHGRIDGTQAEITFDFSNTENPNNSISSFSIDNDILAISAEGRLLRGSAPFPNGYQIGDFITASITAKDQFRNDIICPVSVSISENLAPTFNSSSTPNLVSPLASSTTVASLTNIFDIEGETVDITATTPNHTLKITPITGPTRDININNIINQSNTVSDFDITITATDQFGKSTTSILPVPVAANQPPNFDISLNGLKIASNATSIGIDLFTITNITDPENDSVSLSITNDSDSHSSLSLNASNQAITTQNIPGNTTSDSIFTGNITANDGVNNTIKSFHYVVSGNQAPQFTVTPLTNLKFPLSSNDALANITSISDDLDDNVTFIATSTIGDVSIDSNDTSNSTTKYIRLNNNNNQQSSETFTIDITGSDSYNNQTKTQVSFNVGANIGPNLFTITPIELTASISKTTSIATIEGATDPDGEPITLSIADPNFTLSSFTGPTSDIFYIPGIPGTTLTSTLLEGTIVATDPVGNNVSVNFENTIAGNSRPFQSFTAEPNLIKPLGENTLLGTLTYNEDDGEIVSFTISDNIILTDETPSFLDNGITKGTKNVLLKEANINPVAETINFSAIIADENDNEGENSEFSVIVDANDSPTFTFSQNNHYFKAGEYNADDTVITITDIEKGNSGLPINLSIDSNTNFYLDNAAGDSANTIIQLDNISEESNAFIKIKNTIPGTQQDSITHTGTITLTNGSTTSTQDFTIEIKGNESPSFNINPETNLTIPINKDKIVATVTEVTDKQIYTSPNFEFNNDIPFTASVLLVETNEPVGARDIFRNTALRSTYNIITASAESTSGSGNTLVTNAQDVTLSTPTLDFGDAADFTTIGIPYLLNGSEVESFETLEQLPFVKSSTTTPGVENNNLFFDFSDNNSHSSKGFWQVETNNPVSQHTGPRTGGLRSDQITDNFYSQQTSNDVDSAYAFTETSSPAGTGDKFILRSPLINLNETNANEKLILYYHAHGANIGQFKIFKASNLENNGLNTETATQLSFNFHYTGSGNTPITADVIDGPKHDDASTGHAERDKFHRIECDISNFRNEQFFIYFEYTNGTIGTSYVGDFAIDNIHIKGDNVITNKTWQSRYITASHFLNEDTDTFTPQRAFDNTSNFWKAHRQADSVDGGDVTLDFDFGSYMGRNPIITKIAITQDTVIYHNKYRISGSLDGETWTPLHVENPTIPYSTDDRDRDIQIDNTNGYRFYRITADKDNNNDSTDGPGLKSTIFYETPAVTDASAEEISQTYIIVTQSFNDTTNWDIIYNDDTPETNVGEIALDVKIEDKYGNFRTSTFSLNYLDNGAPTFDVTSASFVTAPNIIQSPITVSQQIATIENITDPENEEPYTCSVFTDAGLTTVSPNFVASTGSNTDTALFFITCSSEYSSPLNTSLTLYVKVEDNFGSFNSQQLTYDILGDNAAPIVEDVEFTIDEFIPANTIVGQLIATDENSNNVIFNLSNNTTQIPESSDDSIITQIFPFNISSNGIITTNVIPTASILNTFNDGGTLKHPLIVTATDQYGFSSGDQTIFIHVTPNTAPIFISSADLGSFDEFTNAGSSIASLSATDFESNTFTFETSSTYTDANLTKIAVDCNSNGNLTFRIKSSESMHNNVDNTRHEFDIDVVDEHGARTSQTFFFSIIPNLAPTFHEGSTAGAKINGITYTAPAISEDETAYTQSIFYNDSNGGNTITIDSASGTPPDSGSYWSIHNVPELQSVEFRQEGDLEFDTHPTFTFIISASDNHYQSGDDPDAFTPLTVTLDLVGADIPTFNNDISGINEFSPSYTQAGVIIVNSPFEASTIEAFQFHQAKLDSVVVNVTSFTDNGGPSLMNPAKDPFFRVGSAIQRKSGVILNSDIINEYIYSCSIKSPGGNVNSTFISIPIQDHNPGTKTDNGPFNIIESAVNSDFVFTETEGFGTNVSNVTFSPPAGFNNGYSFEVSSSNQFFNQNPTNGTVLEFQLAEGKDLSGSGYIFPEDIAINYTASLIGFETSKLFGTLTATITSNSAPPLTSQSFTNNWNDVDASTTVNSTLVQLTVGSDPESDAFDPNSFVLTPTTNLTHSINGNQIDIIPKTSLTVGSSPYPYTASVADIHGFRTSSVSGSIAIVFGDTGSLASSSHDMYVLNTAIGGDNVTSDNKGIGNNQSSLYDSADTVTLSVNYNEPTSEPVNFISPTANSRFNIVNGVLFVNNIEGLSSPIVETVHFTSAAQTPHSGSITVNIVTNQGPIVTFTQEENLQHPITAGTVLGAITIEDDEGFNTSGVSVSDSTNFITQVVNNGLYNLIANQTLNSSTLGFNFTLTADTTIGPSTTTATLTLTILPLPPTGGTLELAYSNIVDEQFYILETATGSGDALSFTPDPNPVAINTSGISPNSVDPKDTTGDFLNFYDKNGSQNSSNIFQSSFNSNLVLLFNNSNNNSPTYMKGDTDLNDKIVHVVYDFQEPSALYKINVRVAGNNNRPNFWTISGSNTTSNPLSSGWTPIAEQNTTSISNPFDDTIDFTDAANFGNYQYYNISFRDHTGTYSGLKFIQYFTGSLIEAGEGDSVVTGSLGIPDVTQAAVLSASFIGSTESDPVPIFSTDSEYFNIQNSIGLGFLQVNENFRSHFDDGFEGPFTQEQIFVTCSTAGTTMENELASITPITINILKNNGPSINVLNQITSLLGFADENTLFSLSFTDNEGDFPVSYVISSVSFTGGANSVIKTEDLTGTVSDSSTINIRGNANLVNSQGGTITFTVTATDSKGKVSTTTPSINVTSGLIFSPPTLTTNDTAYIIETGVDNNSITTDTTGIAGTQLTLSANYDASTTPNVDTSATSFTIHSPNYLEVHDTNKVRLKLNGSQELEDLGFDHNNTAQTVEVLITTTKNDGSTYDTYRNFSLNITENFPPEIDIDAQTQTLGVNFSGESYMSASVLTTADQVYGFTISDIEGDLPINVEITSQNSNLGLNETSGGGNGLLSFNSDGTVATTSTLSTSPGTVSIFPTTTAISPLSAQTINFELTLTDSKLKTQTFSSPSDFTAIEIQTQPPITVSENIYVYGSKHMIDASTGGFGPITNNASLYSGMNSQGNTDYEVVMFGDGVVNVPPALTTIVREQTYGVDYLFPTLEVFNNGWVDGNNDAINLTQFFNAFDPSLSPISHRATISVTEEGVSLNEHFQRHGVIDIGSGQGSNQFIILVPDSPNIEGIPTEMTNAFQQGTDKHVLGISLNPSETVYNEFTGADTFPWIDSTHNSNVHRVEFTTPVDGYTSWYIIGMVGTIGLTSCEIRVQQSTT